MGTQQTGRNNWWSARHKTVGLEIEINMRDPPFATLFTLIWPAAFHPRPRCRTGIGNLLRYWDVCDTPQSPFLGEGAVTSREDYGPELIRPAKRAGLAAVFSGVGSPIGAPRRYMRLRLERRRRNFLFA